MKKLLLCLTLLIVLITIAVLRSKTHSANLSAAQSGLIASYLLLEFVQPEGADRSHTQALEQALARFLTPGAYLITRLGVLPTSPPALTVIAVSSWWIWIAAVRLIWNVVGRSLGSASIAHNHLWLLLVPPWRPLWRVWMTLARWWKLFRYGKGATATWTGILAAMTLPFKPGDSVFVGRLWAYGIGLWQTIGIRGPRHITVVAASGAGKTRWLMAWLGVLHKKASAFVVDCDGQIVNALGPALERAGHKILNLDPYRLTLFPGACWNALDEITAAVARHGREAAVRFAQVLAEALIQDDNKHQPIFSATARAFTHSLILYVWLFEPEETRTLMRVRELLTRGMPELVLDPRQDAFELLLRQMEQAAGYDDGCGGQICAVIARGASMMKSGKGRDGNPFRTTAMSQSSWLDLPEIAAISKRSDFTSADLKLGNPCVFVCAPVTDIQMKLAGWVRALTVMTMYTFQNIPGKLKIPCAFCIDEAPALGRLEILETAAPTFRKYGIRLVIVTQDLEWLRRVYPDTWGSFIGNAQATIWMGTDHLESLKFLGELLGTATLVQKVEGGWFSDVPLRLERREQPLMTPDQLREFLDPERGQIIVTRTGKPAIKVAYDGYDHALPVWRYEADKGYREPLLRRLTRWIVGRVWLRPPMRGGSAMPHRPSRKAEA